MELFDLIQKRLYEESNKHYRPYYPENHRDYKCKVDNCNNPAYAKGYCNAHYIRARKQKDLSIPLRNRKIHNANCVKCDKEIKKGGWNLCSKHYKKARYTAIWEVIIEYLGGKCKMCGESYPIACYDLHHRNPKEKEYMIAKNITNGSILKIANEVLKCDLLCANCHRILHFENGRKV